MSCRRHATRARRLQEDLSGFEDLAPPAAVAIRALPARVAAALLFSSRGDAPRLWAEQTAMAFREPRANVARATPPFVIRKAAPVFAQSQARRRLPPELAAGVTELICLS